MKVTNLLHIYKYVQNQLNYKWMKFQELRERELNNL